MKKVLIFIWEVVKIALVALVIVVPIRYFLFQPFLVKGQSMEPNFFDGDYLIVDQISYRLREPERGEVIVFKYPNIPSQRYIKRIIGLPGETIEVKDGQVFIDSVPLDEVYLPEPLQTDQKGFRSVSLGQGEYFLLGDNRMASSDSRIWGSLPKRYIIGRVAIRAWPVTAFAKFEPPAY